MIPPNTKSLIQVLVEKFAPELKRFKNSNPVIMLGELKLDRIDQKIKKQAEKLNSREVNKDVKDEGKTKKYEKRKAAITYRSYTVEFKRKLISKIREINSTSNAGLSKIIRAKAHELNIHPKNIFRWFHTKEIKKKEGGRKALYPQMQQRLAQFIINNPKMKRKHILRQAKQIMEDLQIPGRQYFNFSKGWYQRFRERLVRRKIIPGKIEVKKQFEEDSDSDFDESDNQIKKQENMLKNEYDDSVKEENLSDSDSDFDEDQEQIKNQFKEQNPTKIDCDAFILVYSQELSYEQVNENKVFKREKKQKKQQLKRCEKMQKQEQDQIGEAKTDESNEQKLNFSNDLMAQNSMEISIFVSDEMSESQIRK